MMILTECYVCKTIFYWDPYTDYLQIHLDSNNVEHMICSDCHEKEKFQKSVSNAEDFCKLMVDYGVKKYYRLYFKLNEYKKQFFAGNKTAERRFSSFCKRHKIFFE